MHVLVPADVKSRRPWHSWRAGTTTTSCWAPVVKVKVAGETVACKYPRSAVWPMHSTRVASTAGVGEWAFGEPAGAHCAFISALHQWRDNVTRRRNV